VAGRLGDRVYLLPEIENDLIHFTHARKTLDSDAPRLHDAKTARESISALAPALPDIAGTYGTLCDYSHPASPTIFRFAAFEADRQVLAFDPRAGSEQLGQLQSIATQIGARLLALGVGPCVLTLRTLNAFGVEEVSTPWANERLPEFSSMWRIIEEKLRNPAGPRIASADEDSRIRAELVAAYEPIRKGRKR
jgi:hypothetical protein